MTRLPHAEELLAVARNTVWYKPPAEALADPLHLVAHVLTFGSHEDVTILRKHFSDDELREALDRAPAGIFDPRSWAYWNLKLGRYPAPALPQRTIPEGCAPGRNAMVDRGRSFGLDCLDESIEDKGSRL